jgi:phosphoenolpyruvate-protein kinase (PTS system EI component)
VLVVPHLDPRLAGVVGRLGGLVAETGSPLSHLAILAREHGVPTVVGHAGATDELRPGEIVEVDGAAGTVRRLEAPASADVSTPDGGAATSSPVRRVQPERELVLEEIGVRP